MGGTMGAVMVSADPRLTTGVLNVPGGGWTHMVPYSLLYSSGMESIMMAVYGDLLDLQADLKLARFELRLLGLELLVLCFDEVLLKVLLIS